MTTEKSLSFSQAISVTQTLMEQIANQQLDESQVKEKITSIIKNKNGGRGFFVAYLTSDSTLADNPSEGVLNALKSSSSVICELLVKNLAMSSAMVIAHNRNNDMNSAQGSQQVCRRTTKLIQILESKLIIDELQKLQGNIQGEKGDYQTFLKRWNYDAEQQQAIQNAIFNVLNY